MGDLREDIVVALMAYFSAPIARAVLTSTLRRAGLENASLGTDNMPLVVDAFERSLPMYLTDGTRRHECIAAIRALGPLKLDPPPVIGQPGSKREVVKSRQTTTRIRVRTSEDVINACEVARDLARTIGFGAVDQTKVATAVAELARNIIQYAQEGEVSIGSVAPPKRGIELIAMDSGPGIADIALVMSAAYRSSTGMGMGLKGAKRIMDEFYIESTRGKGTKVVTRKFLV